LCSVTRAAGGSHIDWNVVAMTILVALLIRPVLRIQRSTVAFQFQILPTLRTFHQNSIVSIYGHSMPQTVAPTSVATAAVAAAEAEAQSAANSGIDIVQPPLLTLLS